MLDTILEFVGRFGLPENLSFGLASPWELAFSAFCCWLCSPISSPAM